MCFWFHSIDIVTLLNGQIIHNGKIFDGSKYVLSDPISRQISFAKPLKKYPQHFAKLLLNVQNEKILFVVVIFT